MSRTPNPRLEVAPGQVWTGRQVQVDGRTIQVDVVDGEQVIYTVLQKSTYRNQGASVGRMRIASLRSAYRRVEAAP